MERPDHFERSRGGHPSRRTFLKGVVAAGLVGPALFSRPAARAQTIDVYVDAWHDRLPPGIAQCRDRWVQHIYAFYQGDLSITNAGLQMFGKATPKEGRVRNSSWFVEPAVYFTLERGDNSDPGTPPDHIRGVMEKTPQMAFFARGIAQYISFWDVKRKYWSRSGPTWIVARMRNPYKIHATFASVEENFVHSLFCCAYPNKEEALAKAKTYFGSDLTQRTEMADDIAKILEGMGISEEPKENNRYDSPYNRNLCALWSATWLVNHYDYGHNNETNKDKGNLTYERIERPIRGYMKPVRGPPYFYDSEGKV